MTPTWHKRKTIKTTPISRVETKCPRLSFLEQAGHVHRAEAPPKPTENGTTVHSHNVAKASKSKPRVGAQSFSKWRSSLRRDCGFSFQAENWQFGTPAAAVALVAPSFSEKLVMDSVCPRARTSKWNVPLCIVSWIVSQFQSVSSSAVEKVECSSRFSFISPMAGSVSFFNVSGSQQFNESKKSKKSMNTKLSKLWSNLIQPLKWAHEFAL